MISSIRDVTQKYEKKKKKKRKIDEARSYVSLEKKKKINSMLERDKTKERKRWRGGGKEEEILCHGDKACISESRGGNREKMPEEQKPRRG